MNQERFNQHLNTLPPGVKEGVTDIIEEMSQLVFFTAKVCCAVYLKPECFYCVVDSIHKGQAEWLAKYAKDNPDPPTTQKEADAFMRCWVIHCKATMETFLKRPCTKDG